MNSKEAAHARSAAYRFLTYRPRSRAEVERKLREKGFDDAVVRTVLYDLIRLGYINDEKFAEDWARSRVRLRNFGRRRIEQELREKGIDREVASRILSEIFNHEMEIETARKAADKKLLTLSDIDREAKRRRLAGFLERKGFSYEVIRDILKNTG